MRLILPILFLIVFTTVSLSKPKVVIASWDGPGFHGKLTANGEIFNKNAYTAAHKILPFGTFIKVIFKGKSVIVRINDRGPFIKGRSIDLSEAAAKKIGCDGLCEVKITLVE